MLATLAVMLLSVYFYFPHKQKQSLLQAYSLNATRTAELISIAVAHALDERSFELVQRILRDTKIDSNVSFIILSDNAGQQFAAFNPKDIALPTIHPRPDSVRTAFEKNTLIISRKVFDQKEQKTLANLVLGYSLDSLDREIVDFRTKTIFFALIAFLFGYIIIKYASVRVTKSLSGLQSYMHEIVEKGKYGSRVEIDSADEVGMLATTFNQMIGELQERHDSLQASEKRLRKANTQLQKINRLKTVFVSDASHQLRTPLTIINGEVEVALQNAKDEAECECKETLRIIGDETKGLMRIVENLLSLAKADAGSLVYMQKDIDFSEICLSQVKQANYLAKVKNIKLHHQIESDCVVTGDLNRLAELVSNLIDNAVKYTPRDKEVQITLENNDRNCLLKVCDSGVGIPKEEIEKIFTRFYRGRNASKNAMGSGLGLAICESIAKAHRGKIHVTSDVGAGSRFELRLPNSERA
ncbi:MAG: sensor histidine kinase [bacterium]